MRKTWILTCILFAFILRVNTSCTGKSKSINPNGDSELALLMREMYDEGMKTKQQLLDRKEPEVHVKYKRIHTAKSTESMHVDLTTFIPYAIAYEMAMDSFISTETSNKRAAFQSMVNTCMNCHQTVCPGPKVKIKQMYFSDAELASLE